MKILIAFALLAASSLQAQDFLPELAPHVQKYRRETSELQEKRRTALELSQKTYLDALIRADAASTSSGDVAGLAVITKEKEKLAEGNLPREAPKNLPRALQAPRKSYLTAIERTSTDFASKQKRIDSEYLRVLGGLQLKANANSVLDEQITKQKKLLLNPALGVLEIRLATYQATDGQNPRDVTAKMKGALESGAPSIKCGVGTIGIDPKPYHGKSLILDYAVGGVAKRKQFADGDTIIFNDLVK